MRRLLALLCVLAPLWAGAAPVLEGRTLRYEDGERVAWQRAFPAAYGPLTGPLEAADAVFVGIGPSVYALDSGSGAPLGRADLPGTVTALDAAGGVVSATTAVGAAAPGATQRFTLQLEAGSLDVAERVVFPPDARVTGWLARVADGVPEGSLSLAAGVDPGNPFLALREAQRLNAGGDPVGALVAVRRALGATLPFPAWVELARRLDAAGFPAAADLALDRARRDAAARGLDPDLPVSRAALFAYGNPSGYAGVLLSQGRLTRAEAWLGYLRELHPRFEGSGALYTRYAGILEAQGREGEAEEWRQFARSLSGSTLYNLGPDGLRSVRDAARLATLTLALGLAAALLGVVVRAWRAQAEDTRALGGWARSWLRQPLARARRGAVAYASLGERIMLTLLGAALVAAIGGWQWANQTRHALHSPALNLGTYGGAWAGAQQGDLGLRPGPDAALLSGLSAQLDGDSSAAREQYTRALPDPCARNNLGVIAQSRGDVPQARELYRAALSSRPDLEAAAFNLGLNPATPGAVFQRSYRPGQPRLCYPDQRSLARATTGDLSVTLGRALRDPLAQLSARPGASVRLGALLLLAGALCAALAVSLVLPRVPLPRAHARPALYRALATLLPGVSLLESAWGGVLLLTWALAVAALAPGFTALTYPHLPTLAQPATQAALVGLLVLTYVLNTLAFIAAEVRWARQGRREAQAG